MADYGQPETYTAKRSNGLGLAGFITSLVGLASCGIISPIALLLSFFALFKAPRGFAFAGFVLGGIGSLWIALLAAWTGAIVGAPMFAAFNIPEVSTGVRIAFSAGMVEEYHKQHGAFPDAKEWQKLVDTAWFKMADGWDKAFDYSLLDDGTYEIRSAGADGEFNTDDDMTSEELVEEFDNAAEHGHDHGDAEHAKAGHGDHDQHEKGHAESEEEHSEHASHDD